MRWDVFAFAFAFLAVAVAGLMQAGMALCALNLKDTEAAKNLVSTLKRDYPKDLEDPIVKQAINAVSFPSFCPSESFQTLGNGVFVLSSVRFFWEGVAGLN